MTTIQLEHGPEVIQIVEIRSAVQDFREKTKDDSLDPGRLETIQGRVIAPDIQLLVARAVLEYMSIIEGGYRMFKHSVVLLTIAL